MSVLNILEKAEGNSGFKEYSMHSMGDKIILQRAGHDDINVDMDEAIIVVTLKDVTYHFSFGIGDYFEQGSKCIANKNIDTGLWYIHNDTWSPDPEARTPDRLIRVNPADINVYDRFFYFKCYGTLVRFINVNGEHFDSDLDNIDTNGKTLADDVWYSGTVTRSTSGVRINRYEDTIPPLAYVVLTELV